MTINVIGRGPETWALCQHCGIGILPMVHWLEGNAPIDPTPIV